MDASAEKTTEEAAKVATDTATDTAATGTPPHEGDAATDKAKARPEREASFKDYIRVFSYGTKWDYVLMVIAAVASIGAGTTLPLMNIVFGKLVGNFTAFFTPGNTMNAADFEESLNRQSLYIFALFIARFGLNYMNKVSSRLRPHPHPETWLISRAVLLPYDRNTHVRGRPTQLSAIFVWSDHPRVGLYAFWICRQHNHQHR
jgi:hypothetical protein